MNIFCERLRSKFTTVENLMLQIIIIALTSVRNIIERSGWYQNVEKITGYNISSRITNTAVILHHTLFTKIQCFSLVIRPCLIFHLFVCMFALYRSQFSTKNYQKIHTNYVHHLVGMHLFWEVKVIRSRSRSPKHKNQQICDNFGNNHRKMMWFILTESSSKISLDGSAN